MSLENTESWTKLKVQVDDPKAAQAFSKDLGPNMSEALVLDRSAGHYRIIWDRTKPDEVAEAKRTYENLKAKRYAAFKVEGQDGAQGEVMREFDPNAERLIMTPPIAGG